MAIYTKIPASNLGATLSKALGKTVGNFLASSKDTLENRLMSEVEDLKQRIQEGSINSDELETTIERLRTTALSIKRALQNIESQLGMLSGTAKAIQAPLVALKAALLVIKLIPLPQRYLVVSITTVFSDTLEMLSELIAQIEEVVISLTSVEETLYEYLEDTIRYIENFLRLLDMLKVLCAILGIIDDSSEADLDTLRNIGFIDGDNTLRPFLDVFKELTIYSDSKDSDDMYGRGLKMVDSLQHSGISLDIRGQLEGSLDDIETPTNTENNSKYYFTLKDGSILTLSIVVDPKSPKIAPRRYVIAKDAAGVIVYEGTKSFADDPDILIEEARVRLTQLFE